MPAVARYVPPHRRRREVSPSTASTPSTTLPSRASSTSTRFDSASVSTAPSDEPDRVVMRIQNTAFDSRTKNPVFLLADCAPIQGRPTATLFVFGDSFIGPFKLIKDHIAYKTYPGAAAKVSKARPELTFHIRSSCIDIDIVAGTQQPQLDQRSLQGNPPYSQPAFCISRARGPRDCGDACGRPIRHFGLWQCRSGCFPLADLLDSMA